MSTTIDRAIAPTRSGVDWVRVNDPRNPITTYVGLMQFAQSRGFTVTSTIGGTHNVGSAHYWGGAVDVRTGDKTSAQVNEFISEARVQGVIVRDERTHPANQKVWRGPHLHLQVPVTP